MNCGLISLGFRQAALRADGTWGRALGRALGREACAPEGAPLQRDLALAAEAFGASMAEEVASASLPGVLRAHEAFLAGLFGAAREAPLAPGERSLLLSQCTTAGFELEFAVHDARDAGDHTAFAVAKGPLPAALDPGQYRWTLENDDAFARAPSFLHPQTSPQNIRK